MGFTRVEKARYFLVTKTENKEDFMDFKRQGFCILKNEASRETI